MTASKEVSPLLLEELAFEHQVPIDLAPPKGGWSRIKLPDGRKFHAWTPPVLREVPC